MKNILYQTVGYLSFFFRFGSVAAVLVFSGMPGKSASETVPWRFAVVADSRGDGTNTPQDLWVNTPVLSEIASAIVSDDVSLVLFPGDLIMGNNYWSPKNVYTNMAVKFDIFKAAFSAVTDAGIPVYPIRGNHEVYDWIDAETPTWEASNAWLNAFGNALPQNGPENRKGFTYSFSHNNAFFAGLEQYAAADYTYDPDNPDLDWLSEQLDSNTKEHVFVFGHAPAFQAVTHECLMRYPDNMSRFWELLHDAGARVYFCAHEHFYGRARACIDNAFTPRQVIIGTGGGPIATGWDGSYLGDGQHGASVVSEAWNADLDRYGYLLVEVDGSKVTVLYKTYVHQAGVDPVWTTKDKFTYDVSMPDPEPSPCFVDTVAATTSYITNAMAEYDVPALSIGLIDDNRLVWAQGFGYADRERGIRADADTIYRIASLSKAFAGLVVMRLAEDNLLDLGDPVTKTIPEFSMMPRYADDTPVTVRSLLSHQSGIPGLYFKNAETTSPRDDYYETVISLLSDDYPNFPAGFMEQYNNNGVTLIEGVVAGASGKDYRECARELLFEPMGLNDTAFVLSGEQTNRLAKYYMDGQLMPDAYVNIFASGGKYSSVRDMARWMSFLVGYGALDGKQVLSSNSVAEVWTDQSDYVRLRQYENYTRNGLGWDQVADKEFAYAGRACWKNGASEGYGSFVMVMPECKLGVVVLSSISGDTVAQPVAREALHRALLEKYGLMWPTNQAVLATTPAAVPGSDCFSTITGRYATASGYDLVTEQNGALTWTRDVQSDALSVFSSLLLHEDGWFYTTDNPPELQISFTNVAGRVFMKKRFPVNMWIETMIVGERFVPSPVSAVWSNRALRAWIVTDLATNSYFKIYDYPKKLNLTVHDNVLMVSSFVGDATLQPQTDDLAFAFAAGGSEVYALQARRVNGREILRYAGYDFRALWTPGGFGGYAADLALYGAGAWYAMTLDGSVTMWNELWGAAGMAPVPGDYNGDGIGDLAVYEQATGNWYIRGVEEEEARSSKVKGESSQPKADQPSAGSIIQWGAAGMAPVPGDYDGDGISDLAVYHPASGAWYIRTLSGTLLEWGFEFGWHYAVPVSGDYDGDGIADLAVYYEPEGLWYIYSLRNGVLVWGEQWGGPGMTPVPGDYNGDGCDNLAVYEQATGNWYIRSTNEPVFEISNMKFEIAPSAQWGGPGMVPVPGDYNGDGVCDLAVYYEPEGLWFVYSLRKGVLAWHRHWGAPGLMPVMAR